MDRITTRTETTAHFLGVCKPCLRPTRETRDNVTGKTTTLTCPECAGPVTAERLVAVTTQEVCDSRCMGAVGPNCQCACGGANHGGRWVKTETNLELQSALDAYRAREAQKDADREKRAARERNAKARRIAAMVEDHPLLAELTYPQLSGWDAAGDFVADIAEKFRESGDLTERQIAAVERAILRAVEYRAKEEQRQATARPVPTGTVTVEGVVLSVKARETSFGYSYGAQCGRMEYKMTVECDGYRVWCTVPRSIEQPTTQGDLMGLRGKRVRFTADVTASDDDPSFGFGKRPRKAALVA